VPIFPSHDKESGLRAGQRFFLQGTTSFAFALALVVWLFFFDPIHPFQLFGIRAFGWLYELLFCLVVVLMLVTGFRLGKSGSSSRALMHLERSRIRFAFSRLKGSIGPPSGGQAEEVSSGPTWSAPLNRFETSRPATNDGSLEKKEALALQTRREVGPGQS